MRLVEIPVPVSIFRQVDVFIRTEILQRFLKTNQFDELLGCFTDSAREFSFQTLRGDSQSLRK